MLWKHSPSFSKISFKSHFLSFSKAQNLGFIISITTITLYHKTGLIILTLEEWLRYRCIHSSFTWYYYLAFMHTVFMISDSIGRIVPLTDKHFCKDLFLTKRQCETTRPILVRPRPFSPLTWRRGHRRSIVFTSRLKYRYISNIRHLVGRSANPTMTVLYWQK